MQCVCKSFNGYTSSCGGGNGARGWQLGWNSGENGIGEFDWDCFKSCKQSWIGIRLETREGRNEGHCLREHDAIIAARPRNRRLYQAMRSETKRRPKVRQTIKLSSGVSSSDGMPDFIYGLMIFGLIGLIIVWWIYQDHQQDGCHATSMEN